MGADRPRVLKAARRPFGHFFDKKEALADGLELRL